MPNKVHPYASRSLQPPTETFEVFNGFQNVSRVGRVSDSVTRQIEVPLCRSGFATPTETFEVFNGFQNLWDGVIDPVPPGRKNLPIRRIQSLA